MAQLSRRTFIALTGSAAVVAASQPRAAWASPMGLPIGIQLYTVGKPMGDDPAGTLKQLYAMGYREVESAGMLKVTPKELRKMIDDAGLKCPSAHLQLTGTDLGPAFEEAHAYGAHFAVSSVLREFSPEFMKAAKAVMADGKGEMPSLPPLGQDGFKKTAEKMNEVGRKAKAAGLVYAYHNHNFEFEKMPDGSPGYDILVKETDPELVKFEIDCGWMTVAGYDPVQYMKNYPGRVRILHIKDFRHMDHPTTDLTGAGRPQGADLGKGFVDYAPIFAAGKAAGIEHIFDEQEQPFAVSQIESAKANFGFLEKFS